MVLFIKVWNGIEKITTHMGPDYSVFGDNQFEDYIRALNNNDI